MIKFDFNATNPYFDKQFNKVANLTIVLKKNNLYFPQQKQKILPQKFQKNIIKIGF